MKKASLLFHTSFIFIFVIMVGNKSINICEERTQWLNHHSLFSESQGIMAWVKEQIPCSFKSCNVELNENWSFSFLIAWLEKWMLHISFRSYLSNIRCLKQVFGITVNLWLTFLMSVWMPIFCVVDKTIHMLYISDTQAAELTFCCEMLSS